MIIPKNVPKFCDWKDLCDKKNLSLEWKSERVIAAAGENIVRMNITKWHLVSGKWDDRVKEEM